MRLSKIMLIAMVIGGVSLLSLSCGAASDTAPLNQTLVVQRGNLTIDITGVGNLALSQKEDLAFEIAGTVAEVLVKEGDTVTQGQVLARLDTSDWDVQLSALEDKVTAAERQLTVKKRSLTTAERQPATKKDAVTVAERQLATKKDAVAAAERLLVTKKDAVTVAERQLATKKDAVTTAERLLATKKRNVTAKERDVLQAEINLKDAQTALDTTQVTYTVADFTKAQAAVDAAKTEMETALQKLSRYEPGTDAYWIYQDLLSSAQSKLKTAQSKLDDMLSGFDEELAKNQRLVDTAQWNLESAQIAVEDAQIAVADAQKGIDDARITVADAQKGIDDARIAVENAQKGIDDARIAVNDAQKGIDNAQFAVEDAQLAVEDAQLAIKDAQKALDDARKALDDAKKDHPQIIAPSAGFITKVNIKGGDEVKKGTVAVTLADPNKFEADILVNETDILQTKLGGNASVKVEAMPGMNLPAKVTHISPTAVIQSGVVNYKVKVELESLQSVIQARQTAMANLAADNITAPQPPTDGSPFSGNVTSPRRPTGGSPFSGNVTSGVFPDRMRQAIAEGSITPEQIAEMRSQRQGVTSPAPGQIAAVASTDFQLREGQTVTVSILVAEKNDVLLVPNGAITRRGTESMVKVLKDGVVAERSITTGISNWQYTEVTSGLSEGETVVVPQNTTTTTPTTSPQNQGGARMIPGMGGFGR